MELEKNAFSEPRKYSLYKVSTPMTRGEILRYWTEKENVTLIYSGPSQYCPQFVQHMPYNYT